MKEYNKLVRDKIPQIIEESGKRCKTRIMEKDEYEKALEAKLDEEVVEFHSDKCIEELADILEVVRALCVASGHSVEELEAVRQKKAQDRGAFSQRIFLEYVE